MITGTEVLETVRNLSKEILLELFRDDKIAEDASDQPEHPQIPVVSPSGKHLSTGCPENISMLVNILLHDIWDHFWNILKLDKEKWNVDC